MMHKVYCAHWFEIMIKTQYILFLSIRLATRQMIHHYSLTRGLRYLELKWIRPKFLPEKYQLKYQCTAGCNKKLLKCKNVEEKYILQETKNLTSNTTLVRISNLQPGTICRLFLLAVYNPASIDSGIAIKRTTLRESTSKLFSVVNYFTLTPNLLLFIFTMHIQRHSHAMFENH